MKKYRELFLPIIIIIVAIAFFVQSCNLPPSKYDIVGPGGFPKIVSLAMGILGVILLIRELAALKKYDEKDSGEEKYHFPFKTWGVYAAYLILGLLLKKIGFSILMFFYMIITLYVLGERKWWKILLIAAIATLVVSVIFINLLNISMPEGTGVLRKINRAINMKNLF